MTENQHFNNDKFIDIYVDEMGCHAIIASYDEQFHGIRLTPSEAKILSETLIIYANVIKKLELSKTQE